MTSETEQEPVDATDGFLDRDLQAAFQALKRRWGWDEAMERLAKIVLKESHWKMIDG